MTGSFFLHFRLFGEGENEMLLDEKRVANILIKDPIIKPGHKITGMFLFQNEWEQMSIAENLKMDGHD